MSEPDRAQPAAYSPLPAPWPSGHRGALIVSIDVDGPYAHMNANGPRDFLWRGQTEYDLRTGVWRLLDLLKDRDVRATFCWVGRCVEDRPDAVERAQADGHESSIHSWDHRYYTPMSAQEQLADARRTIDIIERVTGTRPVGHKTPGWRYNEHTAGVMQQLGLLWHMDGAKADRPLVERPDPAGPPIVQLSGSRFWDDYTFFIEQTVTPRATAEFWIEDLDVLADDGGLLCLTLHPFVSGRPATSRALAMLLDHAIDRGDIWIARADDLARWWLTRQEDAAEVEIASP